MEDWMERPEDEAIALRRARRHLLHPVEETRALPMTMIDRRFWMNDSRLLGSLVFTAEAQRMTMKFHESMLWLVAAVP